MLLNLLVALAMGYFAPLPPIEYRQNYVISTIMFTTPPEVDEACGGAPDDGGTIMACSEVGGQKMLMPHPCIYPDDQYARLLCHELGHISGWTKDHPNLEVYKAPQTSLQKRP